MKLNLKKLWDYKLTDKTNESLRQKALKGLAGFFVIIILFTVLSRAADAMTIAKVKVVNSDRRSIDQSVSADGIVIQNREQAISTISGIKVKDVLVNKGQEVKEGDSLFSLDLEDINEQILLAQYDIQKLELQIADYQSQEEVNSSDKSLAIQHAAENYNTAVKNGNAAISDTYNDMVKAKQKLTDYRNGNSGQTGSEDDEVETALSNTCSEKEQLLTEAVVRQESIAKDLEQKILTAKTEAEKELGRALLAAEIANIETKVTNENQSSKNQADTDAAAAEQALQTAQTALSQYRLDQQSNAQAGSAQTEESLIEAYNNAVDLYDQAVQNANDSKQSTQQSIEDASKDTAISSNIESTGLDLDLKQRSLDKLNQLVENGSIITAPSDGIIMKLNVTIGNITPDGVAVVMADTSAGTKFVAQITKEQQKFLTRNDAVTIKTQNDKIKIENVTINMMQVNEENADMIDVTILLPENSLEIGTAATMELEKTTDTYPVCVPIETIREQDNQNYVLVVTEVETVLGKEYKAQRVDVTISNKNAKYAAIAEGTISSDYQVITSSNKEIQAGDRILVEEE